MKEKLKAWVIHKLGGFTEQEMEASDRERRQQIASWRQRCDDLVDEYGRIETISTSRPIDAFDLHVYGPKICADMVKELCDLVCQNAGRLVEKSFCDDYEQNRRTVTMSIRLIRNERIS